MNGVLLGIMFCIVAMGCFAALYILVARSQKKAADPHGLTLVIFVTGLAASLANPLAFLPAMYPPRLLAIGTLIGIAAGIGIFGTTLSARSGAPASVINTVASLALCVPVALAFVFFHQAPNGLQSIGLVLSLLAIALLQAFSHSSPAGADPAIPSGPSRRLATAFFMALMFLGNGMAQFLQARLHHEGLDGLQSSALTMMYLAGTACSVLSLLFFRGRINSGALRYGLAVGLASVSGNALILRALATTPASVVFPLIVCGPIVLTVVYARVIEGARLSPIQAWGLSCGAVAVLMLTL